MRAQEARMSTGRVCLEQISDVRHVLDLTTPRSFLLQTVVGNLVRQPVVDLAAYRAVIDVAVYAPTPHAPEDDATARAAREQLLTPFVSALAALVIADLRRGVA